MSLLFASSCYAVEVEHSANSVEHSSPIYEQVEKPLLNLIRPLEIYESKLDACNEKMKTFFMDNMYTNIGFRDELKIIDRLDSFKRDKFYKLHVSILGDNIQISGNSQEEKQYFETIKNALIKNGLTLIYENKQLRNTPSLNTDSHYIILKKSFNYLEEEKKLNTYLKNSDEAYLQMNQCYRETFNDDINKTIFSTDSKVSEQYQKIVKQFLLIYPNKENTYSTSLLSDMLEASSILQDSYTKERKQEAVKKKIALYTSDEQVQLNHLFDVINVYPLQRPLFKGRNSRAEIDGIYKKLLHWKLTNQELAKYYIHFD